MLKDDDLTKKSFVSEIGHFWKYRLRMFSVKKCPHKSGFEAPTQVLVSSQ